MSTHLKPPALLSMLSASLVVSATAFYSSCYDQRVSTVNATGSTQIPALWNGPETTNITHSSWTLLGSSNANAYNAIFDDDCYNAILEVVNSNVSI